MEHECNKERELDLIHSKVDKIDLNVEKLLQQYWFRMGFSAAIGAFFGILGALLR